MKNNVIQALDEMTKITNKALTDMQKVLIHKMIPAEIGVALTVQVVKIVYESGRDTAIRQGYELDIEKVLNK